MGRDSPHWPSCNTWPAPHGPWASRALAGHWATSYSVPATWTENCCRLTDLRRVLMAACRLCSARFLVQSASQASAEAGETVTHTPLGAASARPPLPGTVLAGPLLRVLGVHSPCCVPLTDEETEGPKR